MRRTTWSALFVILVLAPLPGPLGAARASWRARSDSLHARADEHFLSGDYELASDSYARVVETITEGGGPEVSSYFVGLRARSRFLMARSLERLEEWDAAIDGYALCLNDLEHIEDAVRVRLAACYAGLERYDEAMDELRVVVDDDTDTLFDDAAVLSLAGYYEELDAFDLALQWYRVYLAGADAYDERALAHYRIGRALERRGDDEAAEASYATVVDEFPRSRHAHDALKRARRLSRAFTDRYHQGLVLYNRKLYRDAAEFFKYYIRHNDEKEFEAAAQYFLGRSYQRRNSFGTAARHYEDAVALDPESEYFDLAWSKLAYCRRAQGNIEKSLATYDEFLALHPDREAAPELLWEKARLLEEKQRWDEARAAFLEIADRYRDSPRSGDARFRAGLCLFKLQNYTDAEAAFADIFVDADGEEAARGLFWAGKCREQISGADEAAARYAEAVQTSRDSYYGARAIGKLRDLGMLAPANLGADAGRSRRSRPVMWSGEVLDFAAWLAEWYDDVYFPAGKVALRQELAEESSFQRADTFLALHMRDAALSELSELVDEAGDDPRALDILIDYCERAGLHKRAILLAERLLGASPAESVSEAPVYLKKYICPTHFSELVERECAKHGLDPDIQYSLMRQESLFEPGAVSWVGARGLSQIMPSTGRDLAKRLGYRGFRTSHLLRPEVNIAFGTEYLAMQMEEFDGDIMRALAAYNGGPDSAERWWGYGGARDSDVFVEDIGYSQTAEYVRRVYLYAETYRESYGGSR